MEKKPGGRPRRGRPPRPKETVRSHRIVTYVTGDELAALERLAEREGATLSGIVHDILARAIVRKIEPALTRSNDVDKQKELAEGSQLLH